MRYEVAMVLIACGTLLALAPPIADYAANRAVAEVIIERSDLNRIRLGLKPMSENYRFGCWALGAVMIGIGISGSWRAAESTGLELDDLELEDLPSI